MNKGDLHTTHPQTMSNTWNIVASRSLLDQLRHEANDINHHDHETSLLSPCIFNYSLTPTSISHYIPSFHYHIPLYYIPTIFPLYFDYIPSFHDIPTLVRLYHIYYHHGIYSRHFPWPVQHIPTTSTRSETCMGSWKIVMLIPQDPHKKSQSQSHPDGSNGFFLPI